ncbi:uncharacterized protein LOC133031990 [Cannabis sativa]|uniref:uncharacterized protein LOC133031990 n=1 Tax=Cannabis sativa TaxID=3483 RepID=UPI0029CA08B6|nr:uncharacterized protein LOC133031990 [Cannabis sativa]
MAMYNEQYYDPYYTSPQEYQYNPYYDTYTYNQQSGDYSSTSYNGINQYVQPTSYYPPVLSPDLERALIDMSNSLKAATLVIKQNMIQCQQNFQKNMQVFQQSLQKLENLAESRETSTSEYEIQCSNIMPSQVESDPIENVSGITVQSGTQLESPHQDINDLIPSHEVRNSSLEESSPPKVESPILVGPPSPKKSYKLIVPTYVPPPPFPSRLKKSKKEEPIKEILETLPNIEVKIPCLEEIKEETHCANILKELCPNEKKLNGGEKVSVGENENVAVHQRKLLPETSTIPCTISKTRFDHCMIDLGEIINNKSYFNFAYLNLGPSRKTQVFIQSTDQTNAYPLGIVKDIFVQAYGLVIPGDSYITEMEDEGDPNPTSTLLGRPFLLTASEKLDTKAWILRMEFDGETLKFNVLDSIHKYIKNNSLLEDPM